MGALTEKIRDYFTSTTRKRGQDYFVAEAVRKLSIDGSGLVTAKVGGSEMYDVCIDIEREARAWTLFADCTCSYGASNDGFCKHIWATLLKVEGEGRLDILGAVPSKVQVEFADGDWEEEGLADALLFSDIGGKYIISMEDYGPGGGRRGGVSTKVGKSSRSVKTEAPPQWLRLFQHVPSSRFDTRMKEAIRTPPEPIYILEAGDSQAGQRLVISLGQQNLTATGKIGKLKKLALRAEDIPRLTSAADRTICLMLMGAGKPNNGYGYYNRYSHSTSAGESKWSLASEVQNEVVPLLFDTGRFKVRPNGLTDPAPLTPDNGLAWELVLAVAPSGAAGRFVLEGRIRRGSESVALGEVNCIVPGKPGLFLRGGVLGRVELYDCFDWLANLRHHGALPIEKKHLPRLLTELDQLSTFPPFEWPADWQLTEHRDLPPRPELALEIDERPACGRDRSASAEIAFRYGETKVDGLTKGAFVADAKANMLIRRQSEAERRYLGRLMEFNVKFDSYGDRFVVPVKRIPTIVATLMEEGWTILGNHKPYRQAGDFKLNVSSGIDWFELDGAVDFGGQSATLPELLAALRKGERFVVLGDGSVGMLPEVWLAKHRTWLEMGQAEGDCVRFAKTQLGLMDALLAELPEATFDAQLAEARRKLSAFTGIKPRGEPVGFTGRLREYQSQGLGWLDFLHEFGWGGCLADDMGLGKTVQLLAFLADRLVQGDSKPSLVVAPKSLMFNWSRESERFTPGLRVLTYTGLERKQLQDSLAEGNLVLTTYGTLRRDIEFLRGQTFNYVVLDEAQAIKNPESQNAKATRLLCADHRLVLTGTPVENHLGDLWSLFEFLNPGMLGTVPAFKSAFGNGRSPAEGPLNAGMLQRMLRPFILRRTKDQVAPELPPRSEQTIVCEMGPKQSAYYRELRDHYRTTLLARVDDKGLARSKIHVLEALLRLRQAACHPGLIDASKKEGESAKLESLFAMIGEFVEKGQKALVFSQFTSLLSIVRAELDRRGVVYEYLDGRTQKRERCVDRFQSDASCPLFLISLKAGGTGLNLTAADYVFILDPWWNPAVEAQAIDRTHRIGQVKKVIAYRLIARDTVEEKILELQKSKRALAEAIIAEQNSLIQDLSREDLAMLLS